jgi:hypothetical protein
MGLLSTITISDMSKDESDTHGPSAETGCLNEPVVPLHVL